MLQEPDSYGIRWEATPTRPGYGPLLLSLMDALYPIIPGSLFFVEGTAQECEYIDWHPSTPTPCLPHLLLN